MSTLDATSTLADEKEVTDGSVTEYGGHATQILWKGTEALGCAVEACEADGLYHNVLVCNYDPP